MPIHIVGFADEGDVFVDGKQLHIKKSLALRNHSPSGFSWGYAGSGCAQLALAILLEVTDKQTAEKLYQSFKFDFIAGLPLGQDFDRSFDIKSWLLSKGGELK